MLKMYKCFVGIREESGALLMVKMEEFVSSADDILLCQQT